ncbi:aldehyde dehydrogenase family protein [Blastococcus sp. PRF04-17]|uniref:aldehyde dehydrogenase family protein n=1 Tax=Blastococcus sp. PRF04-17 TaxID=2933797 RepID=UPI001FF37B3A|nr:aldehyde dehydrogenase family protein [Blastococcus sp. PRF04-17]UOY02262.1 aldehyde dehydrogenase family protein [Blastococcus sp. PRF04-17]
MDHGAHRRLVAEETDIPAGVLNVVHSSDHSLGAQLTADPRVDAISFTGSTATGRKVMAAAADQLKRVHLELGGKSPSIVLDDADLERVVPLAAALGCFNAGQSCILPSRLLVPAARLEECLELAAFGMASVPVGDPFDESTFMGPLVSATHRDRVLAALSSGLEQGGRVVVGGGVHPDFDRGFYVQPTLVASAPEDGSLVQEETFGPIVVVQAYEDVDDAVRIANGTPFGLAGYVWSEDEDRARGVAGRIRAGMIGINGGQFTGGDMPFGGVGASGLGREWGVAGLEEFLELKTVAAARFA